MAKTYTRINQINGTEIATTHVASHAEGIDDQPIGVVISGTQTTVTSSWTGNAPFTTLEDNQIIYYYLPYSAATSTDVTLNLTLSDGTTTGANEVYFDSGTNMKSKFEAGSIIPLIFKSSRKNSAGTTLTDTWMYVPDASSYCTPKNMAIPFFIGTGTAAKTSSPYNSARWTYDGASEITLDANGKPANGTTICVRVPVAGHGSYGTGLSLDNGTNYYPVCANVTTMVGTRYAVDASVILTFNSSKSGTLYNNSASGTSVTGIWQVADYTVTDAIGYQIRSNSASRVTSDSCRYYKIFFSSADDKKWVPACASTTNSATSAKTVITTPINPFGPIVYNSSTTAFTANSTIVTANSTWQQYLLTLGYSFNRTGAALTLTANAPVYIKCAPQADGSAIIDATTPYVQALPSSNDGKIYIFLGFAYSATQVELRIEHPIYYHDGTALKLWTGPVSAGGTIDITVPTTNATYPILLGNTDDAESDVPSIQKSVGLVVNPNKKSVAEGSNTTASGNYSHAEGYGTTASSMGSHAEGCVDDGAIEATAEGAHAEGYVNSEGTIQASDSGAHAEGCAENGTIEAASSGAYAGGYVENGTIEATSSGAYARGYVEDGGTIQATSCGAHAEGYVSGESNVTASLTNSIAFGSVYGNNSRVYSNGETSVAIGNIDANNASIEALTDGACAIGCIEGDENGGTIKADGKGAYAGGYVPEYGGVIEATSSGAHAEGYVKNGGTIKANGFGAHAEGCNTNASGLASHAEGIGTIPSEPLNNITGGLKNNCFDSDIIIVMPKQQFVDACVDWDNLNEDVFIGATFSIPSDIPINANALPSGVSLAQFINSTLTITSCSLNSYDTEDDYFSLDDVSISFVVDGRTYQINSDTFESGNFNGNREVDWDNPITIHINNVFPISVPNAFGAASHTEGNGCQANGDYSHAEGSGTYTDAAGVAAHAEGAYTKANNSYSHAEGFNTIASGLGAHAEGRNTESSGNYSHAEGYHTDASGEYSHAEGTSTFASGLDSHAEGCNTITIGTYSHAEGGGDIAYTTVGGVVVTGVQNGNLTVSSNTGFTIGELISYRGYPAKVTSKGDNPTTLITQPALGKYYVNSVTTIQRVSYSGPQALGDYSHAEGGYTKAYGQGSHAEGWSASYDEIRASEDGSHAEGCSNGTNSKILATGKGAHAEGRVWGDYVTEARGSGSHAEGMGTKAYGETSHAEGYSTLANGTAAHAEGNGEQIVETLVSGVTVSPPSLSAYSDYIAVSSTSQFSIGDVVKYNGHYAKITANAPANVLITKPKLGQYFESSVTSIYKVTTTNNAPAIAEGVHSHIEGFGCMATGTASHAGGYKTFASGDYSFAGGVDTTAGVEAMTAIGRYNESAVTNELFAIGNGNGDILRRTVFNVVGSNSGSVTSTCTVNVQGKINASTGFFQTSDINKKNVIGDLDLDKAYELIDKCQTILYTLKDDESNKQQVGLIAQEVKEFFPELITEDEKGVLSLDYSRLTVIILRVLKDVIDRVKKLENK